MFLQMLNILGPVALITLIGFILGKSSVELQSKTLSTLVLLVATPALVFSTLTSMNVDLETIGRMAGAALFCIAIGGVIALVALTALGAPIRSFLPCLILPNSGNLGLPLVVLAFGSEGARLGISFFFVVALFQYSVGATIASGTLRIGDILKQPLIYSVLLVLLVAALDLPIPQVIQKTTEMLGGMMIPAMLILLGNSLATLNVSDLAPAFSVAIGRLLIGIIAGLVVIYALDFKGTAAGVVFLMSVMPSAIVTYVFAERYDQSPVQVAGAVVMSTLLTFCCLPVLVWVALGIGDGGLMGTFSEAGISR